MENHQTRIGLGWPNRITITRILLTGPFIVCLLDLGRSNAATFRWLAIGIFAVMAVSDGLDGYLARKLHAESDLGKFLDPLADKLLITAAVIILWVRGVPDTAHPGAVLTLPNWVAVAALGKDILIMIGFGIIYLSTGQIHIQPRFLGKCCTAAQLILVLSLLLWPDLPASLKGLPRLLWIVSAIMAILAVIDYIRTGSRLLPTAQSPRRGDDSHASQ